MVVDVPKGFEIVDSFDVPAQKTIEVSLTDLISEKGKGFYVEDEKCFVKFTGDMWLKAKPVNRKEDSVVDAGGLVVKEDTSEKKDVVINKKLENEIEKLDGEVGKVKVWAEDFKLYVDTRIDALRKKIDTLNNTTMETFKELKDNIDLKFQVVKEDMEKLKEDIDEAEEEGDEDDEDDE